MRTLGSTSIHKFYDDDEQRKPLKVRITRFGLHRGDPTPTLGLEFDGHEVSIILHGDPNLDRLCDMGYAIIAECQKLQPAPIDFGESLEANLPDDGAEAEMASRMKRDVEYAINDAVELDNAMDEAEAINYKPD
jgi:hypothetical protein